MDRKLAEAFALLTTGIYVITVAEGELRHGMSSSWVTQVSGEPPLFMAAVDNNHFSRAIIARTGAFGFNVVGRRGKQLEDYFFSSSARRQNNLEGLDYELSPVLKVPWLSLAMVSIEARVKESFIAGDHTLFIAEVVSARTRTKDRPLTSLELEYVYVGGREVIRREPFDS